MCTKRSPRRFLWFVITSFLGFSSLANGDTNPESLLVGFKKSESKKATGYGTGQASANGQSAMLSSMEVSALHRFPGIQSASVLSNRARLAVVKLSSNADPKKVSQSLLQDPGIRFVEPNYPVVALGGLRPNDPLYNDDPASGPLEIVSLPYAWQEYSIGTRGPEGPKVCIIDTGIDYTHPDIRANMWINEGEIPGDGIDNDNNGYIDDVYGTNVIEGDSSNNPMDENYHGTHVAGIVGADTNNAQGMAGVAWETNLIACKFLDADASGTVGDAVKCIDYCLAVEADITVNSWGGEEYSQALHDIIDEAQDAGQLFVTAAGNSGNNVDISPLYPGAYEQDIILNVAATTTDGLDLSWFSNYGAWSADMSAPGTDIMSTMPGGEYNPDSGTSMACPIVAGAAVLLKSYNTDLDAITIKRLLMGWGDELDSMRGFTLSGKRLNVTRAMMNIDEPLPTFPDPPGPQLSPTMDFESNDQLDGLSGSTIVYTYQADAGENTGYTVCADDSDIGSSGWQYDPEGGTETINLQDYEKIDDGFVEIEFPEEFRFYFFGREQASVFASSNGFLTFGRGDKSHISSSLVHFGAMRISALFADLLFDSLTTLSYKMHDGGETFVVTYENVTDYSNSGRRQSFQVALLSQGQIKLFYKSVDLELDPYIGVSSVLVGVSLGIGVPEGQWETDFLEKPCASPDGGRSTLCCEDLQGFGTDLGSPLVCQGAKMDGKCHVDVGWRRAKRICERNGARLCTVKELEDKEARRSECNWDKNESRVWTSDKCPQGLVIANAKDGSSAVCKSSAERRAAVQCCADSCKDAIFCPREFAVSVSSNAATCTANSMRLECSSGATEILVQKTRGGQLVTCN